MDEYGVERKNVPDVFKSAAAVARLSELISTYMEQRTTELACPTGAVVGGRTLDLASSYTCAEFTCLATRVDRAFLSIWHYFDSIVLAAPSSVDVLHALHNNPRKEREKSLIPRIADQVEFFTYLRSIGADKYIIFQDKEYSLCRDCHQKLSERLGLTAVVDRAARREIVARLELEAEVRNLREGTGSWVCEVTHEFLPETLGIWVRSQKRPVKWLVFEELINRGSRAFLEDLHQSEHLGLPLLQEVRTSLFREDPLRDKASVNDVALSLRLPFLEGLKAADIILLMQDERPSFERFQASVRRAIAEKVEKAGDVDPATIGESVMRDHIRPALAEIEQSMKSAKRAFAKKASAGIGLGAALVTAGLIAAIPVIIGAGVAAAATPLVDLKKLFDDQSSVESKDMYFLWNLGRQHWVNH
ncbi:hypothetical protein [Plantactinospora endophytica]|nr:hypothetical protein [Plantactinospora endophytica]